MFLMIKSLTFFAANIVWTAQQHGYPVCTCKLDVEHSSGDKEMLTQQNDTSARSKPREREKLVWELVRKDASTITFSIFSL